MTGQQADGRAYWKWAGLGFEFAGVVAVFCYFGHIADHRYAWDPWGKIVGGGIGLIGGMYWLVKEGFKMMRELDRPGDLTRGSDQPPPEHRP